MGDRQSIRPWKLPRPEALGIKYTGAKLWVLWIFIISARVSRFWHLEVSTDPVLKK